MSAVVIIQEQGIEGQRLTLGTTCAIGRIPGNDLVLDDVSVSRNHALIRRQGDDQFYLSDLGSSNGTFLNDRRITVPQLLKTSDHIRIGKYHLRFAQGENPTKDLWMPPTAPMAQAEAASVLVVDVRNFTKLGETLKAEQLSSLLKPWFHRAEKVVERHGGLVDRFIGDAMLALWPRSRSAGNNRHAIQPVLAARELVALADQYHREQTAHHASLSFKIGCGISVGEVSMGNVGTDARRDYTIVGDCVNVAFRLESLCKTLNQSILICPTVHQLIAGEIPCTDLGLQQLKGKSEPMCVYSVNPSDKG